MPKVSELAGDAKGGKCKMCFRDTVPQNSRCSGSSPRYDRLLVFSTASSAKAIKHFPLFLSPASRAVESPNVLKSSRRFNCLGFDRLGRNERPAFRSIRYWVPFPAELTVMSSGTCRLSV